MKNKLLVWVSALIFTGVVMFAPAKAADSLPMSANNSWTGGYLGLHAGYGFGNSDWTFNNVGGGIWNNVPGDTVDYNADGILAGGQAGYMWQQNNLVLGADVSISAGSINDKITSPFFPASDNLETDIKTIALVQARVGWAQDNWLVYFQGGYAGADTEIKLTTIVPGFVNESNSRWQNGWTAGAGFLMNIPNIENISVGAEYSYIDLGSSTHTLSANGAPSDSISVENKIHSLKLTLNYHFGNLY